MTSANWEAIFDECERAAGASDDVIVQFQSTVFGPMTPAEQEVVQGSLTNPFPQSDPLHQQWTPLNPANWIFPTTPLPDSYLDLLRWSNGGCGRKGDREFGFFPALDPESGVRAMMLAYHVPEYMPLATPFAFNGGGVFYLFDMRKPPVDGEYPILACPAGALGFEEGLAIRIADSLPEACSGTVDVESLREGVGASTIVFVDLTLTKSISLKQLAVLRQLFRPHCSVAQLKRDCESLPFPITRVALHDARAMLVEYPELLEAVVAYDCDAPTIEHPLLG